MTVDDTIIVGAFSSAFAVLTGTIAVLWRKLAADHAALLKRVDRLEQENAALHAASGEGKAAISKLSDCPSKTCPYRDNEPRRDTARIPLRPRAA